MVLIGLLCLIVFGPNEMSGMARDLGGMVRKLRSSVDEFKSELTLQQEWEDPDEDLEEYEDSDPHSLGGDSKATKPRPVEDQRSSGETLMEDD